LELQNILRDGFRYISLPHLGCCRPLCHSRLNICAAEQRRPSMAMECIPQRCINCTLHLCIRHLLLLHKDEDAWSAAIQLLLRVHAVGLRWDRHNVWSDWCSWGTHVCAKDIQEHQVRLRASKSLFVCCNCECNTPLPTLQVD